MKKRVKFEYCGMGISMDKIASHLMGGQMAFKGRPGLGNSINKG